MRSLYLISQEIIDITDQNTSLSVMSVVSVVKGLCLIVRFLKIIDTSNKNTTFNVISVISVVNVMSVMRSLYLISQEIIDITDQNTSLSFMSVVSVVSVVKGLCLIV